ncbi:MAG TPA: undecaprenyldiphospho-muramoylpentapeptide beta-N-acetylglucosaminyltransferase [Deltaproteobacteria bacterium]|nr:undecaprenyldiphospho-muramoylpentapeptide beta-N-acetylglucosaminyltransferase [Deltaproteobacteria bacterium]
MRLIIAGGGTGGHLFPGIAVAEEFLARDPYNQVLFVGTVNGIEARVVPAAGYGLELISAAGIRGKGLVSQAQGALMMVKGFWQSRRIIKNFRPDMVLGVGGYASLPMLMAARQMEVPCFIHEQNAIPGKTNRLLSRMATLVFVTVAESVAYFGGVQTLLTGNPLRRQILNNQGHGLQDAGPAKDVDGQRTPDNGQRFHLLVFGGSQGARAINNAMTEALPFLKQADIGIAITHQTGAKEADQVSQRYQQQGVPATVTAFIDDMAAAYRQADLVICRAGATTIAELTACAKAALFIPFPHAVDDHQRLNAEALVKNGAGFMLLERDLSGVVLSETIIRLAADRALLQKTGELAFGMARPDAAKIIVDAMTGLENRRSAHPAN